MSEVQTYVRGMTENVLAQFDLQGIPSIARAVLIWQGIAALLILSWAVVHQTGGTAQVFVHVFYIPVLIGAVFFGPAGGVVAGAAAGILCGPFMPLHTATGEMQAISGWSYRAGFFVTMGALAGSMVSMLRRQARLISERSRHSVLTGIPNQVALEADLDDLIRSNKRSGNSGFFVVEIGIWDIQRVIAAFGHHHANRLLQSIGSNLQDTFASAGRIYHTQVDRFAVVTPDDNAENISEFCGLLIQAVQRPSDLSGLPVTLRGRVGLARYPVHGTSGAELSRACRFALREAEAGKHSYAIFDRAHDTEEHETLDRLTKLKAAIDDRKLVFHYQPKLDLDSGEVTSVEALVRWPQPSGDVLPPGAFVPAAEGTGLITLLSAWGLRTAIAQLSQWRHDDPCTNLGIAVNLSALDLQDGATVRTIKEMLALYDVAPHLLEIEVTETSIIEDFKDARRCLDEIKALGVRIAIDDFGTGHAGLVQLKNLPVDIIKIDKTFVKNILTDSKDNQIVRSAIDLGHNLDLKVVAEGVETDEILHKLREYGCDVVQGYGIARPMPEEALRTWLRAQRSPQDVFHEDAVSVLRSS
jgi:predicted signal transduction protein with EAL and GGDEF domain